MNRLRALASAALLTALLPAAAIAENGTSARDGWYVTAFAGALSVDDTSDIFSGSASFSDAWVFGGSVGKTFARLTDDLTAGAEAIVARHAGAQDIWEFDGIVYLRWHRFPWQRHVRTSFALGMGPSISSEVPPLERARHGSEKAARVTNFIMGEIALGLAAAPDTDLVLRYHHRSGIFGLVNDVGEGSTMFGAGLKRTF